MKAPANKPLNPCETLEMSPEQITLYQEIAHRLQACKFGQKQAYLKEVCAQIGVNLQSLYRNLEAVGFKSGKKEREDKGSTTIDLNDARLICNMMHHTRRKNEKRLLSCTHAIEIAFANGQIGAKYSPSSVLRVAKMNGFHPDQLARPTPHQNMQSLHPNHVWQVDASIGTLFYLPQGGVEFFDEREHYKNKPQNVDKAARHVCVRYVVTDHYSGAIYVKYYSATGETQEILFDVLVSAFEAKNNGIIMHGVPHMLVMDKGAANTAHSVVAFLNKMHIINWAHCVGNSRAKGQVEKAQDIIERNFEGGLRLMKTKVQHVNQLNELALKWQVYFNASALHSRSKTTRYALWQTINPEQLRIAPARAVMEMLLSAKPILRTVQGDLTISFKGKNFENPLTYSVEHIENIKVKDQVLVTINPYRAPNIDVITTDINGKEIYNECTPIAINKAGFHADAIIFGEESAIKADTISDKERKAGFKTAYDGAETLEAAKAKAKKGTQLYSGSLDPFKHINDTKLPVFMQRSGTEMDISAPAQIFEKISVAEACKRIKAQLGNDYPPSLYQELSQAYKEGIDPLEVDAIVANIRNPKLKLQIV